MAWNWGTAGQGAASGAAMGSAAGPYGALGGAVIGGIMSGMGGGDTTTPGTHNVQWLENPQYAWTQPNMQSAQEYYNNMQAQLEAGRPSQAFQQYQQATMPRQRTNLSQTYFGGSPWGGGLMDQSLSQMTKMGTPVGKRGTQQGKMLSDYATKSQGIDELWAQLGAQDMKQSESTMLSGRQGMMQFQGPQGSWDVWNTQGGYQQGAGSKIAEGMAYMAPYVGDMTKGWFKPTATQDMNVNQLPSWMRPEMNLPPTQEPTSSYSSMSPMINANSAMGSAPITQNSYWNNPQTASQMAFPFGQQNNIPSILSNYYTQPNQESWAPYSNDSTMNYSNNAQYSNPSWMYGAGQGIKGAGNWYYNNIVSPEYNALKNFWGTVGGGLQDFRRGLVGGQSIRRQ